MCINNQNGCGQVKGDLKITLDLLAGFAANPNVYGTLVVGLGCELLQYSMLREKILLLTNKPLEYVEIQKEGGIARTVEKGRQAACRLVAQAAECRREPCDISRLILGTECGGSDPSSGLCANLVVGDVADRLSDLGGTSVVSETAEFIGAEHVLAAQARTPEVARQILDIVKRAEEKVAGIGENIRDSNPSPGNIAAGVSTLEEKSLGCVRKAGTRPIQAVFGPCQMIDARGTVIMDTVCYDVVSVAEMTAGGAQVTVFTTGMGTPVGNPIAPVLKLTANRDSFERNNDFMDFDASPGIWGEKSVHELGAELLQLILRVCDGKQVKAEEWGMTEIAINRLCTYD